MTVTTVIDSFEVASSSRLITPQIWLSSGGKPIATLSFEPNGTTLPLDSISTNGQYKMYYHLDDYMNIIDILRNKGPVKLIWTAPGTPSNTYANFLCATYGVS